MSNVLGYMNMSSCIEEKALNPIRFIQKHHNASGIVVMLVTQANRNWFFFIRKKSNLKISNLTPISSITFLESN